MIVPSIDIQDGLAVQLRRGRDLVLEGGDPMELLDRFAVAGEVAVVDLDAAMGRGSNAELIRAMVHRHACRVGGGIRSLDAAREWLDEGAAKIVIGTAATPEFLGVLPRDRIIAAVDAERGTIVVNGWQRRTDHHVIERVRDLAPFVSGFLLTQVEHEGAMQGFDFALIRRAVAAAGDVRVTAAGGITTADEIAELDAIGVDAQVGMALYSGRLTLGDAFSSVLAKPVTEGVWPTIVNDELGETLGLVWSNRQTVARAVNERRGIYWSRSRNVPWVKGETSGNTQRLVRAHVDCDRDAIIFVVMQEGSGFCHAGTRSCFGEFFTLGRLERTIQHRMTSADSDSGTLKLAANPELLRAKLREEADELSAASAPPDVIHEAADLTYFMLVALARGGGSLEATRKELERRHRRESRRPMQAKPNYEQRPDGD